MAIDLLVPEALIGLGRPSGQTILAAAWYIGLTAAVPGLAYWDRGIGRATGLLVIGAYLVFAGSILVLAYAGPQVTLGEDGVEESLERPRVSGGGPGCPCRAPAVLLFSQTRPMP